MGQTSVHTPHLASSESDAVAARKMFAEELSDGGFVDATNRKSPMMCPPRKVHDPGNVTVNRPLSVAALGQMVCKRVDVGGEWAISSTTTAVRKVILSVSMAVSLEWNRHCAQLPILCIENRSAASQQPASPREKNIPVRTIPS